MSGLKYDEQQSRMKYVVVLIGFVFGLVAGAVYADTHRILNENGQFDNLIVCSAYDVFLDGGLPSPEIECDDMTAFLIHNGKMSLRKFITEYQKQFPTGSNFELLLYALNLVDQNHQSIVYNNLRIAQNHLFGAFFHVGDKERASVYGVLIERLNRKILSAELPSNSSFLTNMPAADLGDRLGVEFSFLSGDNPFIELACFLKVDNLRVPVRKVAASAMLQRCIKFNKLASKP